MCSSSLTTLADVLEPNAPARYSLSARAAAGILRRAEKRGRDLPPALGQALGFAGTVSARYGKGTDSDATDGIVVNALDRQAGGPDDNAAQAGHLIPVGFHLTQGPISLPGASLPLGHKSTGNDVQQGQSVRRLTPVECERLQGFPDGWTAIKWRGKPAPDSRRYAALGDAVTVPVAEWLGQRLLAAVSARAAA